jgi:hypothetical protein
MQAKLYSYGNKAPPRGYRKLPTVSGGLIHQQDSSDDKFGCGPTDLDTANLWCCL